MVLAAAASEEARRPHPLGCRWPCPACWCAEVGWYVCWSISIQSSRILQQPLSNPCPNDRLTPLPLIDSIQINRTRSSCAWARHATMTEPPPCHPNVRSRPAPPTPVIIAWPNAGRQPQPNRNARSTGCQIRWAVLARAVGAAPRFSRGRAGGVWCLTLHTCTDYEEQRRARRAARPNTTASEPRCPDDEPRKSRRGGLRFGSNRSIGRSNAC